jgi:hypothetical protein
MLSPVFQESMFFGVGETSASFQRSHLQWCKKKIRIARKKEGIFYRTHKKEQT